MSKTHLLMWEHSPTIQGLVLRKAQEYEPKVLLEFLLKLGVMIIEGGRIARNVTAVGEQIKILREGGMLVCKTLLPAIFSLRV